MKFINISLISLFFSIGLIAVSCDKVEHPVVEHPSSNLDWSLFPDSDTSNYNWPVWTENTSTLKNVLLEDYTGHTCTNCPAAGLIAKGLEDANPNRVFVASVHAGIGSAFQVVSPPEFLIDFRTEAGNTYVNDIAGFFGNPAGTINRKDGGLSNSLWFLASAWTGAVNSALTEPLVAKLQLQYNYFPQTRGLFVHTESEFINTLTDDYGLTIYLVREVVIAPQKLSNGAVEEHYHHHSVLSDNINGTWGTKLATENSGKLYNNFSFLLPDNTTDTTYNITNLALISYIYNKTTLEVAQVIKTELE